MAYILIGGAAVLGAMMLYQLLRNADLRKVARWSRWIVGGGLALLTAFLIVRGQVGPASITGYFAFLILKYGRIGRFTFEGTTLSEDNESTVKSRFLVMNLDHDSGSVQGKVVAGSLRGRQLIDLNEVQTRQLLVEVAADPDSLALLETWLDQNRTGWREYFAEQEAAAYAPAPGGPIDLDAEAYQVLGLEPGASEQEIRAAHKKLMLGVHPDQGGSNYLAAKINAAKDRLVKAAKR